MAEQINPKQKTAGQLILDIKEHFEKNNAKAVSKHKIRNLEKIVLEWMKKEFSVWPTEKSLSNDRIA